MKSKIISIGFIALTLSACKKTEIVGNGFADSDYAVDSTAIVSDSISMAATQNIKDKQFVKTVEVDMEVKDAYDATISIEKQLKSIGGFVTNSRMEAQILHENTYNTSDESAILIRRFQNQNKM